MAKIVVSDIDFEDTDLEQGLVEGAGIEFARFQDRTPEGIIRNAAGAQGIITSYGNFTAEVFEALPDLRVVSRTGVGFDSIDIAAATEHGVAVCNVPGYGTEVVSDHAITLALACLRRINELDRDIKAGVWDFARTRPLGQCAGRIFGVVAAPWQRRQTGWASRWCAGRARSSRAAAPPRATTSLITRNFCA